MTATSLDGQPIRSTNHDKETTMTMSTTEPEKLTYTINEVAHALSIGRSTVYELINTGKLPSFTIGARRLIARADVEHYVKLQSGAALGASG
ncbi:MAG: helix-turn-helix domain-containing protein [Acidimicrobiales bacterium]